MVGILSARGSIFHASAVDAIYRSWVEFCRRRFRKA